MECARCLLQHEAGRAEELGTSHQELAAACCGDKINPCAKCSPWWMGPSVKNIAALKYEQQHGRSGWRPATNLTLKTRLFAKTNLLSRHQEDKDDELRFKHSLALQLAQL